MSKGSFTLWMPVFLTRMLHSYRRNPKSQCLVKLSALLLSLFIFFELPPWFEGLTRFSLVILWKWAKDPASLEVIGKGVRAWLWNGGWGAGCLITFKETWLGWEVDAGWRWEGALMRWLLIGFCCGFGWGYGAFCKLVGGEDMGAAKRCSIFSTLTPRKRRHL